MPKVISTKLVIEGESEYKRAITEVNASLATFKSQLSTVKAETAGQANSLEALTQKQSVLNDILKAAKTRVEAAKNAFSAAQEAQKQYAQQVADCRTALENAQQAMSDYEKAGASSKEELKRLSKEVETCRQNLAAAETVQEKAQKAVASYANKVTSAQKDVEKFSKEINDNDKYLAEAEKSTDKCAISIDNYGKKTNAATRQVQQQEQAIQALANALTAGGLKMVLSETIDAIQACIDASVDFEQAMAGVRRTVGGSDEEMQALGDSFKRMALEMPITTTELAGIATTAGQLGVARDQVEQFTEIMAKLATTTDLTADNAATLLAQFANITGLTDYERLGSVVAELGDATATTASKVVEMSQGMAAAANMAGFQETEIMAISAAVGSLGIEAQAGSTAMSTLISTIYKSVETGGGKLSQFASIAGMSAKEFSVAWRNDAAGAFTAFIEGLNKNEESAIVLLEELGITNVRQTKAILGLAGAGDLLSSTIAQANKAWEENTALSEKAGIMYETTEAKMTMLSNSLEQVKIAVGDELTPSLNLFLESGTGVAEWAADLIEKCPWLVDVLAGVVAGVGALSLGVAGYTAVTAAATPVMTAFNAALEACPAILVATAIIGLGTAVTAFIASASQASSETDKLTDSLKESKAAFDETAKAITDENARIDDSVTALIALAGAEGKSTAQKEALAALVDELNESVPNLNLAYNQQTDTLNMTTEALREYVAALAAQKEQQATIGRMTELYSESVEIARELEQAQKDLAAAQTEYDAAMEEAGEITEANAFELSKLGLAVGSCKIKVNELTAAQEANAAETESLESRYNELASASAKVTLEVENTAEIAEEAKGRFFDLNTVLKETEMDFKLLAKAQNETSESGYLSLETVKKIMESGYGDYLVEVEGGYKLVKGALDDYIASQRTDYELAYNEAESAASAIVNSEFLKKNGFDTTTASIREQISAMAQLYAMKASEAKGAKSDLLGSYDNDRGSMDSSTRRELASLEADASRYSVLASQAESALAELDKAQKSLDDFDRTMTSLRRDSFSTGSKKKGKTAAEKELDAWKDAVSALDHQRAMDEISEEEYYERKKVLAEKYLSNNQAEREKWEESYYAWQKESYTRELDALNKVYEEEKISLEDYLSARLELQNKHFEESDEKWQAAEKDRQKKSAAERVNAYNEEKDDLDYFHRMGIVSDQDYYEELARLRDKYLDEDSDAWRTATLAIHDYLEDMRKKQLDAAEKAAKEQETALKKALDEQLKALKDSYSKQKDAAKDAYNAQKEAAKEAYETRKQQIKDELTAEKERLNTIIDGIEKEIQARKELREDESQDDAIARAKKRLEAAQAQLQFARSDEDKAEWEKEVIRRQEELNKAVQDKEDTAFYREKEAEKESVQAQIKDAEKLSNSKLTEAEAEYNKNLKTIEDDYKANLARLEANYNASVSRLESGGSSGRSGSTKKEKTYSDEVRAISRGLNVDLGVAQDMYDADARAIASGGTAQYGPAAAKAAKEAATSVAKAVETVAKSVVNVATNVTKNATANVTVNSKSGLSSGQVAATVAKVIKKMSS